MFDNLPKLVKSPVAIVGGLILIVVIFLASKGKSTATANTGQSYSSIQAANQAASIQIAQINAQTDIARINAGVATIGATLGGQAQLANIEAQRLVALSKIQSDENVSLQGMDYQYAVANQSLENNRILGLTSEDTKRLISTQTTQAQLTLGMSALDTQRYLGISAIDSAERQRLEEIASGERVSDFTSSRALTYAQITGRNQVDAIKANKPGALSTFLGALGGGLGRGITSFLGAP
ncbi:MAG TPA: hypothetical protein VGO47_14765 [Chlamydiales bacterium]|jgi:hypothetical protein|nr:hypothetical protein [Chlamydiales bacterium]